MKKIYLYIAVAVLFLLMSIWIAFLLKKNSSLADERNQYKNNTEILSTDIEKYKVQDSLNGARVKALELSLDEFERYRSEDAKLINQLKQKNRDLESVTNTQAQTIIDLMAAPKDTTIIRDSIIIPAKYVRCGDPWYDFEGIMTEAAFEGKLKTRDSLIVSESVQHKRFLGFLWKTHKVVNRQVDVVSSNPHTDIQDIVYVVIED